ncbi:DUF547 domain-containing protein [Tenacibaculum maritimum]|uniref:DUF547 domain-containing protein n=1 Tax=Tenacibaculum maritimum TaxID=107401 RepID=UPI001E360F3E|nr:DUF547 domain-containing protein [Tenacibaculum maritimum]MCD9585046.1 DUF547 domain-containing protein [Tenacibaculum maritimum]MCD9611078.1 DUF547 domain-containing protein [Tenacibaculum maritimum]MCD9620828.1 DUF547 domain-containing protein [Tenacibaculum maritimum]MCD9626887.1 DUF547 domain-containing protein [Tenacibaculum maritimum]MCD9629550.1 DUF547 domain-containing protein [Tenacibaculum maritimum]
MKNLLTFTFALFFLTAIQAQTETFDTLLKTNVTNSGNVNYKGIKKEEAKLDNYLAYLAKTTPDKSWSKNKTKAFWINAYNAYTIKLIIDNYPIKSILKIKKKGKDAWNIPFAKVGGKNYTLNHIEHEILRKEFSDPRIHVGVNCASISCPKLGNFAYTESNINTKLEALMKTFINDTSRNKISENKLQLSKIFEWFKGDFTKTGSLVAYLNKYANTKIASKPKIRFLEYNWNLNGK